MKRSGFTLVEMIIVIGIIAILAGLAFYAVASFVTSARNSRTSTTVKKINEAVFMRSGNIVRFFISSNAGVSRGGTRGAIPAYVTDQRDIDLWSGTGPFPVANRPLAEMLAQKRFVKRAFPMTFAEAGIAPEQPGNHDPATENSECLYHFLTQSFSVGSDPPRALSLSSYEIADTDNDGLLEVVDAWGNPIRFYRWPTRMIRPQPAGSESLPQDDSAPVVTRDDEWFLYYSLFSDAWDFDVDPDDEFGILVGSRDAGTFTSAQFENAWHTIETWHAPLIVSAGEDGELGLFEPTDKTNRGDLGQPDLDRIYAMHDDISNWKLTTLGRP